jgi:hypothetical protein
VKSVSLLSEVVVKENVESPSIPASQHLCPICHSSLESFNHISWSCSNLQCSVIRVVFGMDGRLMSWNKLQRKGEAANTLTRIVSKSGLGCMISRGHSSCEICGQAFCVGDVVTSNYIKHESYRFYHESCYESAFER